MLNKSKSFITQGIVIKRSNVGETDKVVTFITQDHGKLVGIAKGVRSLKSSKRAQLEPGNLVKIFVIETKSMPIITQTSLLDPVQSSTRSSLADIRSLSQILEVFDRLFMEGDGDQKAYLQALKLREAVLIDRSHNRIQPLLSDLIEYLGYQNFTETPHHSILDYVAEITERKMKSFEYLRVK